jgi:integrase
MPHTHKQHGIRRGETAALQWNDIDFSSGRINTAPR